MKSPVKRAKGWFVIPGVQAGDRTLEDQRKGLDAALEEVSLQACGSRPAPWSVLDLGCAEGLISLEFARAGAGEVLGVELVNEHVQVATFVCKEHMPPISFVHRGVSEFALAEMARPELRQFDLVLALAICHKLKDPGIGLRYAARAARHLLCFRNAARFTGGQVHSKHGSGNASAWQIFRHEGLVLERSERSSRGEVVEYWRRP